MGPAQAFSVSLGSFDNSNPNKGDLIYTIASVIIDSNERVVIENINMTVDGEDRCLFNPYNGSSISSCIGVHSIEVLNSPSDLGMGYGYNYGYDHNYGYNYGYSNGNFTYKITLNTSYFDEGVRTVQLYVNLGPVPYSSSLQTFNVIIPNQPPVAQDNAFTLAEGSTHSGAVTASDADGDSLTFALVSDVNIGTLTFNADGSYSYTAQRQPTVGFVDTDSFTFQANDGSENSNIATVNITIIPVNDAPVAYDSGFTVAEGDTYSGSVTASDVDGDSLTFALVSGPSKGTLTLNADGSYNFNANGGIGSDSFTFRANDSLADSNIATVDIIINATSSVPTTTLTANYPNTTEYNGEWTTQDITITLDADDIASVTHYLINGENLDNYTTPFTVDEYSVITYWSSSIIGSEEPAKNFTVRITAEGPIGGDWEFPDGSSPESAENVTLHSDLNLTIDTNSSVLLPAGTVITSSTLGGTINLSALTSAIANTSLLSGLTGTAGVLQFGIPNLGLSFTPAITLRIYVGTDLDNQTINVYRSTTGTSGSWTQTGLVNTTCTVSAGICEFQTNQASYFAAANSVTSTTTLTTYRGGGACMTEWTCSAWSACENGMQTRTCSYPINFCAPTTNKPIESTTCVVEDMPVFEDDDKVETQEGFFSIMTGFVIGNLLENPVNMTISILILLIIVALLWLVVSKRKASVKAKKVSKSKKK